MIYKILEKIYHFSLADLVKVFKILFLNSKKITLTNKTLIENKPPTLEYLMSDDYLNEMRKFLPYPGSFDLHEAQNNTSSYRYRHHSQIKKLGIFRWRGIEKHKDFLIEIFSDPKKLIIDLGGAACPVGFNTEVMDIEEFDLYNNKVKYNSLDEIKEKVDVVFTSHTLEHIPEIENFIVKIKNIIKKDGLFIIHVPSFFCEDWRVGIHHDAKQGDHVVTFGTSKVDKPNGLNNYCDIDVLMEKYFRIDTVEYCGDDSIFMLCYNSKYIDPN